MTWYEFVLEYAPEPTTASAVAEYIGVDKARVCRARRVFPEPATIARWLKTLEARGWPAARVVLEGGDVRVEVSR